MAKKSSSDLFFAEELMFEILSWLPVKSLLRFKYVCRSWFSIISSPTFIETNLENIKKTQPSSLIWLSNSLTEHPRWVTDVVCIHTIFDERAVRINIPRNFVGTYYYFRSCNGLLFHLKTNYSRDCEVLFVWNPLTKWLKELPAPKKKSAINMDSIGFGFDFISNDYKILRHVRSTSTAELYSFNSDSWKEIQVPDSLTSIILSLRSSFVHANGVLYSVVSETENLLAFDLHNEVFGVFSLPNCLQHTQKSPVLDYEGLAAMIFSELDGDGYVLSLRTFNGDSWTKKFNLQLDHQKIKQVYLYLGVGQFVAGDKNGENIIYDHRKKQTKKLPLSSDKCLDMYTGSLVSMHNVATQ